MLIFSQCLFHLYSHCGTRHFKNFYYSHFTYIEKKKLKLTDLKELTVTKSRCNCQRPPTTSHLSPPTLAALRGRLRTKIPGTVRGTGRKSGKLTNIRYILAFGDIGQLGPSGLPPALHGPLTPASTGASEQCEKKKFFPAGHCLGKIGKHCRVRWDKHTHTLHTYKVKGHFIHT